MKSLESKKSLKRQLVYVHDDVLVTGKQCRGTSVKATQSDSFDAIYIRMLKIVLVHALCCGQQNDTASPQMSRNRDTAGLLAPDI